MHKIIKIILKSIGWLTLLSCILAFIFTLVINSPRVQDFIISKTFNKYEDKLGNNMSYSKVKLRLFNKAIFENLLIRDLNSDTIIYAPELSVTFPGLIGKILFKKELPLRLGTVAFEDTYFRLAVDSNSVINIRFIIDLLTEKKDTLLKPKPFYVDRIKIKDSRFSLSRYDTIKRDVGIDLSNMVFNQFNLKVEDFISFADTINFHIDYLSFMEKSGFKLEDFTSEFHLCNNQLYFDDMHNETGNSLMGFSKFHFNFNSFQDFSNGNFFSRVKMSFKCTESKINALDIGYFSKIFQGVNQRFSLMGEYSGSLDNLNGHNFLLSFGDESFIKGKFDILGLPDAGSAFLVLDIDNLILTPHDIENLQLPHNKKIVLPDRFKSIKKYQYSGNFTGFFRDFVSYGTLVTDFGSIETDVMFKPGQGNEILFSGNLICKEFDIGKFAGMQKFLGKTTLNFSINGKGEINHNFDVDLNGDISLIEVNGYGYQNIQVDGNFAQNRFNGIVNIDDPNAKLEFDGLIDLSSDIRQYNFTANVLHANLYQLNFNKKDPNYTASFLINADISGNNPDNLNGKIKLYNSLFSKSNAQIQVYDLQLDIKNDSSENKISLTSDFLDGSIYGHFRLSQLVDEYLSLVNKYLPALSLGNTDKKLLSHSDFDYNFKFKNSLPVFTFFLPGYEVDPNTIINGKLVRNGSFSSVIHLESPHILAKKTNFTDLTMNSEIQNDKLIVDVGCKGLNLNKRLILNNFTLESSIDSNIAQFDTRWINWDSTLYKGNLNGRLQFLNHPGQELITQLVFGNSSIVLNDTSWSIEPFSMMFDSSSCTFDNLVLKHDREYVRVNGVLSDQGNDSLICNFNSFNFALLNFILRSSTFKFDGVLSGKATITGYKAPLFFAAMTVNDFSVNGEVFGDTYIKSRWDNSKQSLAIDADVLRGKLKTLKITGDVYPSKNNRLDLLLKLDKFKVEALNPYLKAVFENIKGLATGDLELTGDLNEPVLNGVLNLQKIAFTVGYLKTRYNFTSDFTIANNNLIFDNIPVYDEAGNTATLNGVIYTEYFRKYNLDLTLIADKFLFLNTKETDNTMFYGIAYASGIVQLNGEPSSLKFDITCQTEPGTIFNIPVTNSAELSNYTFIKYLSADSGQSKKIEEEYKVNLTGMQLNFDLKITPDATLKIVFDPTMGDIIEGKGSGDMKIAINTIGDFTINGEYVIESGKYPFTLQNVVLNRKFIVEKGSTLRWTGDPLNCNVDINTYYPVDASLDQLDPSFSQSEGVDKVKVLCQLKLKGKLMQPDIKYDIELPNVSQTVRDRVEGIISTEEQKTKQFIALVFMNRFIYAGTDKNNDAGISSGDVAGVNASEVLSTQVSNWLSQLSDDVDIGVRYHPKTDKLSTQQVEIALSKTFLSDRLSINGSVTTTNAEAENASSIVGDVDIDYKIDKKSGRLRAKAYNRSNDVEQAELVSRYTQGVGVFYIEEFDEFREITDRYFGKNKEKKKKSDSKQVHPPEAIKQEELKTN